MATAVTKSESEVSFEVAMTRLEKIVGEMESGKLLLEDLLRRYEEGMKLVKVCQERLTRAEEKIEIITRDYAGKVKVKNFEQAETNEAIAPKSNNDDEDVRLF